MLHQEFKEKPTDQPSNCYFIRGAEHHCYHIHGPPFITLPLDSYIHLYGQKASIFSSKSESEKDRVDPDDHLRDWRTKKTYYFNQIGLIRDLGLTKSKADF